ncbi:hypothetical protein B0H15DRAFT_383077 [Mycena belliarum]|uniref:Uncharacterized protein n=1 Tax=Mycena belliarum TaxID=1033014 RepID=A0AAD6U2M7_9AGAR|nr:hypothetical protein B0H15DRAFT_383077 [Mycena belliae]
MFVLQLSLAPEGFFDGVLDHTLAALRARITVSVARSASQAFDLLASPDLTAVFVTDPGIVEPKHIALRAKLVAYAKAGGSVVIGGMFSSFVTPPKLNSFFREAWGLQWATGSYHRVVCTLNPGNETVQQNPSLLPSYSMKAVLLKHIGAGMALYTDPYNSAFEAPACQTKVGLGRLGYVGDVNGEQGSTNVILAMLGVLDTLPAPLLRSGSGAIAHFILHLPLNEDADNELDDDILSALHALTTVSTVQTAEAAMPLLASPALSGVFITDPAVAATKHAALLARLVAYTRAGGTVVLGGAFSSLIERPVMEAFFQNGWGVSWRVASYTRSTFVLNRRTALAESAVKQLQNAYVMKAVTLTGVPTAASLYLPGDESHIADPTETPVVFAEVGNGRLGYVGDVSSGEGSMSAILAMFGLRST